MSEALAAAAGDMAESWHVSAELCRRFLEGPVSVHERRALVRHLITGCPECSARMRRITSEGGFWFGKASAEAHSERDYAAACRPRRQAVGIRRIIRILSCIRLDI
jgi:hypothetical protein